MIPWMERVTSEEYAEFEGTATLFHQKEKNLICHCFNNITTQNLGHAQKGNK